jgi:hypothetical protein
MFNYTTIDDKTRILVALTKIFVEHKNKPMDAKELYRELYDKYKIDCRNASAIHRRLTACKLFDKKDVKRTEKRFKPEDPSAPPYAAPYAAKDEFYIKPQLYDAIINNIGYDICRMTVSSAASKLEELIGKEVTGKSAAF